MHFFPKNWRQAIKNNFNIGNKIVRRFIQVFADHGVEPPQIPRLLPSIKLDDLQSPENLLSALTPEILDQTAKLFGIRVQWLEGIDDEIYEYRGCYKHPKYLFEHLADLGIAPEIPLTFPLRVLTNTKRLDRNNPSQQLLAPFLVEKIAELGDESIYRYHIYRDEFNWGYEPSRIQLKAMTRVICQAYRTVAPLYVVSDAELRNILDGKVVPRKHLLHSCITSPSLEDYCETREESLVAKEIEELPAVMQYIEQRGLSHFSFQPNVTQTIVEVSEPEMVEIPSEVEEERPRQKSGKRAETQARLWEPIRAAAKTLWAEDGALTQAEVIRRIKKMTIFKASVFTQSAIRKQIADLAPPIAKKPGRRRTKSP